MSGGSVGNQDAEEKFDPAAAIWEQQIKKKKQAEAKNTKRSIPSWTKSGSM